LLLKVGLSEFKLEITGTLGKLEGIKGN